MNEVRNIIVGFELGEANSQICYFDRTEGEPISLSVKAGASQYVFPTCLSKKPGEDVYHYGTEAEYFSAHQGEILIDGLLQKARSSSMVSVEDEQVEPARLLAWFFRQAMGVLGANNLLKNVSGIMVTVPKLNKALVDNCKKACHLLQFPVQRFFLQEYEESFFYYTTAQRPEFWTRKVGLFTIEEEQASFQSLVTHRQGKPAVSTVKKGKQISLSQEKEERDTQFCRLIQDAFGNDVYSGVFLVGNGFDKEWAEKSVPLLCQGHRHVFYGNNLYCKGACYAAKEKVEGRKGKEIVYHSEDMVTIGIGMEMIVGGVMTYYPVSEPGMHWYEASREFEILLEEERTLIFLAGEYKTDNIKRYSMQLSGLPKRPPKATRLRIQTEYESPECLKITVTDLGLGELFPSSGLTWDETLVP